MNYGKKSLGLIYLAIAASVGLTYGQAPATDDEEVIKRAASMSAAELKEVIGVYGRLNKAEVLKPLAEELLSREPDNELAKDILAGKPFDPGLEKDPGSILQDQFALKIESLKKQGRNSEIISSLTTLRESKYSTGVFPYQQDLAYAYYESGNYSAARREFSELANSSGYPAEERADARKTITEMERTAAIKEGDDLLKAKDTEGALAKAESLLKRYPGHPDVLALQARALTEGGRPESAMEILESLRSKHKGSGIFPYESEVGGVYLALKDYDAAAATFQKILDSRTVDAAMKREATKGLEDVEMTRELERGYSFVIARDAKNAAIVAEGLRAKYPTDPDVDMLEAEIKLLKGDPAGAVAQLEAVKSAHFPTGPFPSQPELAIGYYKTGKLEEAASAYQEVVGNPFYPVLTQQEAAVDLRSVRNEMMNEFAVDGFFLNEDEGDAYRVTSHLRSEPWNDWRVWAWGRRDDIHLNESPLLKDSYENYEGGFSLERRVSDSLSAAFKAGVSNDDIILGLDATLLTSSGGQAGVQLGYNVRAEDSLTLEALDGREHRLQGWFNTDLTPRVSAEGFAYVRQVELFNDKLGDGYGGELAVDYLLVDSKVRRPAIRAGYAGEMHYFNSDRIDGRQLATESRGLSAADASALASEFVEEEINLHGLRLTIEGRINDKFAYFVQGAAQYDFFDKEIQYRAGTGLEIFLSDTVRLSSGLEYLSAGQTSSSAAGVILGNLGISVAF